MENATEQLLKDLEYGHGSAFKRAQRATPATKLTPALQAELNRLRDEQDLTMGYISKALVYSQRFKDARQHSAILRLIKGGHIDILRVHGQPPEGTFARRDSPFGTSYYWLEVK